MKLYRILKLLHDGREVQCMNSPNYLTVRTAFTALTQNCPNSTFRVVEELVEPYNSRMTSRSKSQRSAAGAGPAITKAAMGHDAAVRMSRPSGGTRSKQAQNEAKANIDILSRRVPFLVPNAWVELL